METEELSLDDFFGDDIFQSEEVFSEDKEPEKNDRTENTVLNSKYSTKQVGSIASYNEPLNGNAPLEIAEKVFKEYPLVKALPVEEYDQIEGIIERETVEKKSGSLWQKFSSPKIIDLASKISIGLNASDYIENVMDKVLELTNQYGVKYFPVFENKGFYGLVTFDDFLKRTSEIREQDMEKAASIQQSFFPTKELISTLPYKLTYWNKMANPLGGDMFLVYKISDTKSIIACADVSGKNVSAALLTMVFSSFFSVLPISENSLENPVKIISMLDAFLEKVVPPGNFITCAFCYVDDKAGKGAIFNCGHTECYLIFNDNGIGKVCALQPTLPPLGMGSVTGELSSYLEKVKSGVTQKAPFFGFRIQKGTHVNLYSDGFTDMKDENGERFEEERAKKFFKDLYLEQTNDVSKKIEKKVSSWCGEASLPDDITVLDIRF